MLAMERRQILAIARAAFGILVIVAIAYQAKTLIDGGFFRPLRFFAFFTILSNLFGAVLFIVLAARWRATRTHAFDVLRGAAVLYLVVTFVIVLVLLSGAELLRGAEVLERPKAGHGVERAEGVAADLPGVLDVHVEAVAPASRRLSR